MTGAGIHFYFDPVLPVRLDHQQVGAHGRSPAGPTPSTGGSTPCGSLLPHRLRQPTSPPTTRTGTPPGCGCCGRGPRPSRARWPQLRRTGSREHSGMRREPAIVGSSTSCDCTMPSAERLASRSSMESRACEQARCPTADSGRPGTAVIRLRSEEAKHRPGRRGIGCPHPGTTLQARPVWFPSFDRLAIAVQADEFGAPMPGVRSSGVMLAASAMVARHLGKVLRRPDSAREGALRKPSSPHWRQGCLRGESVTSSTACRQAIPGRAARNW